MSKQFHTQHWFVLCSFLHRILGKCCEHKSCAFHVSVQHSVQRGRKMWMIKVHYRLAQVDIRSKTGKKYYKITCYQLILIKTKNSKQFLKQSTIVLVLHCPSTISVDQQSSVSFVIFCTRHLLGDGSGLQTVHTCCIWLGNKQGCPSDIICIAA